jgi:hypothetical protein
MAVEDPTPTPDSQAQQVEAPSQPAQSQVQSGDLKNEALGYIPVADGDETAKPPGAIVLLGNDAPMMQVEQPDGPRVSVPAQHLKQSVTRVEFNPDSVNEEFVNHTLSTDNDRMLTLIAKNLENIDPSLKKWAVAVSEIEQIVAVHSGSGKPAWVESDIADLRRAIAAHFGCAEGQPTALLTTGGRDALHAQHLSTSAQPASFNYIALTANSTTPAAADTTLSGEITTVGGGLLRAQATYAHTAGTNTTTLTKTFTANGSDSLPVTIAKIGVFNASSSGTMAYETLLNATATLTTSGDNVTVTETVTAG